MMDGLEQAKCWDAVHDPKVAGELNAEQLLGLMQAAGYSEAVCQKAASHRALERLRRDLKP